MLTLGAPLRELFSQGGTLLVPSRQRAAAVRLAWAGVNLRAGRRSWDTPRVLTPLAWLQQHLTAARQLDGLLPRLLSGAEEWVLWQRAAAQLTADGAVLLSEDALARALRASAQLASDHDIAPAAIAAAAGFDLESDWLRFAMRYVEQAASRLQAMAMHQALQAATPQTAVEPLRTLGLEPLPAGWARLLSSCGATALADAPDSAACDVHSVKAANSAAELRFAAQWCREKLAQNPQARLQVVVPDLARIRDSVIQLWRDELCPQTELGSDEQRDCFVLEGGEPLTAYPWISQLLDGIAVLTRAVAPQQFASWLLSPFWPTATRAVRARLAMQLRRDHFQPCSLQQLLLMLSPTTDEPTDAATRLGEALGKAFAQLPTQQRLPRDWAQSFSQALIVLECASAAADSALAQQLRARWQELLEEFADAGRATGVLDAREAAALLLQLARQASFAPATGDAAVTITASAEHPIASCDGIWVCRCGAATWPAAVTPDPFLPRVLQAQAGIREASATGQLAIAAGQLQQWRICTRDLRLSWAEFIDDAAAEPSTLLAPFPCWTPVQPPADALQLLRAAAAAALPFEDDTGPLWPQDEPLPGGSRSLERQSECAFRAFAELRLGAAPLDLAEPGVDRRERGKLLHAALERFWRQTRDLEGLQQLSAEALAQRIADVVQQAAAQQRRPPGAEQGASGRDWLREQARARRQLERLCEFEKERSPFRVAASEYRLESTVAQARLRLRFDRIDEFEDGSAALIDYKASDPPQGSQWLDRRPGPVQLLVYVAALQDGRVMLADSPQAALPVSALATLHLGRKTPAFHGVSDVAQRLRGVTRSPGSRGWTGELAAADWPQQLAAWRARVALLAQQFLQGRALPDPESPVTCRYCALTALCRRVERVRYREEDQDDDTSGDAASTEDTP